MRLALCLTLAGLLLDVAGGLIVARRGPRLINRFWPRLSLAIQRANWKYHVGWWAIVVGLALQAVGVVVALASLA